MPNPIFGALNNGNNGNNNMFSQFMRFMNDMRGQDPNKLIQQKISEYNISQNQLNQIQQKANELNSMFSQMRRLCEIGIIDV